MGIGLLAKSPESGWSSRYNITARTVIINNALVAYAHVTRYIISYAIHREHSGLEMPDNTPDRAGRGFLERLTERADGTSAKNAAFRARPVAVTCRSQRAFPSDGRKRVRSDRGKRRAKRSHGRSRHTRASVMLRVFYTRTSHTATVATRRGEVRRATSSDAARVYLRPCFGGARFIFIFFISCNPIDSASQRHRFLRNRIQ